MDLFKKFSNSFWNEDVSVFNLINMPKPGLAWVLCPTFHVGGFLSDWTSLMSRFHFFQWKKIKVWLPPNITWADIEPGSRANVEHADYRHLLWPIPISFVIILIRFTVERWGLKCLKWKSINLDSKGNVSIRMKHRPPAWCKATRLILIGIPHRLSHSVLNNLFLKRNSITCYRAAVFAIGGSILIRIRMLITRAV